VKAAGSASDEDNEGDGRGGAKGDDHEPAPPVLRPVCSVLSCPSLCFAGTPTRADN
jgi:hypothetical protein